MLQTRRQFIRQMACSAVGYGAIFSMLGDLRRLNAVTATSGDYRALVCVFLYGGNDGNNTLVPYSQVDYNAYAKARDLIALSRDSLLPLTPASAEGIDYALHPSMPEVQALFKQGHLAFVRNVGTLVAPITRDQYLKGGVAVPPQLFAHSDQATLWQTSISDQASTTGWGGRTADLLASLNANAKVSMNISVSGINTFQVGRDVFQYIVSPAGQITIDKYTPGAGATDAESRAISQILARQNANIFENAYRATVQSAIDNNQLISNALAAQGPLKTIFPANDIAAQLQLVARLISIRGTLGHNRQIFFCAMNGFDTDSYQLDTHAKNLSDLSQALSEVLWKNADAAGQWTGRHRRRPLDTDGLRRRVFSHSRTLVRCEHDRFAHGLSKSGALC